jgi:hypothetical protein
MNFANLVELDSRIGELLKRKLFKRVDGKPFCANGIWYGYRNTTGLKWTMQHLVGFGRQAGPAKLQTEEAYRLAYKTIYSALPDCRDCICG